MTTKTRDCNPMPTREESRDILTCCCMAAAAAVGDVTNIVEAAAEDEVDDVVAAEGDPDVAVHDDVAASAIAA
eukprot:CAMPEP_0196196230 /NCGR_PEP_ID=MMETSP0912-20130531/1124_1 /TAXON_ID=49265 /ORGANISM="Thalassiosira rotula, Strain GSO102" /LENGTH=72 /DNA_ID=CAMNT_0041468877 /DNA_START=983 /DNA_END=1202 /DNA_ORIENTATION=+